MWATCYQYQSAHILQQKSNSWILCGSSNVTIFICVSNLQRFLSLGHHANIYNHMMNKYEVNINSLTLCVPRKPSPIFNLSLLYVFIMDDSYTIFTILFNTKLINFKYKMATISRHTETHFHYANTFIDTSINTLKWLDNESDKE